MGRRRGVLLALAAIGGPGSFLPAAAEDERPTLSHAGRFADRQRQQQEDEETVLARAVDDAVSRYLAAKREIRQRTGLSFSMEASAISQWGAPGGGYGAVQAMFTPNVEWQAFKDDGWGSGSFQFSYMNAQYWSRQTAASLGSRLGLVSPINDYTVDTQFFQQATYTHHLSLGGPSVALTLGQYAFQNFDGNTYANDQQTGFIANSLSQNGSQAYSQGSLGAYLHVYPVTGVALAGGFQDGNNPSGSYIQFNTFGRGQYAWFLYGGWRPEVADLGRGHYSLLYYNLPGIAAQPQPGQGWSFNAAQPVTPHLGLFARANTASGPWFQIQSSLAGGAVWDDPLERDRRDRIGLALGRNRINQALVANGSARSGETFAELYWAWAIYRRFLVTPDLQLYLQPALAPSQGAAAVFSLRLTQLF